MLRFRRISMNLEEFSIKLKSENRRFIHILRKKNIANLFV